MYININKETVENTDNIAGTREEFINGGYVELTPDIEDMMLALGDEFDILEYLFPLPEEPVYITYIRKGVGFFRIKNGLNPNNYNIGRTFEDYEDGKFVPLNDEQLAWRADHPQAYPDEVWNMEHSVAHAIEQKLAALTEYDNSDAVNSVIINGMQTWLTVPERTNYNTSIAAATEMGLEDISFFVGNVELTVSTAQAKAMLAAVQLYADACFIATKTHAANISNLTTVEEVEAYDFTQGYPERPVFNLQRSNAPAVN